MMDKMPVDDAEKFLVWLLTEFDDNGETVMFDDNGETVMFAPGGGFYATPGKGTTEMRLAYVLNCDDLKRAIQLLGKAIAQYNAK